MSNVYYKYLFAIYELYNNDAKTHHLSYSTNVTLKQMISAIKRAGYNFDENPVEIVKRYKKDLTKLGYLKSEKVDDRWRIYVLKPFELPY